MNGKWKGVAAVGCGCRRVAVMWIVVLLGCASGLALAQTEADPLRALLVQASESAALESKGTPSFRLEATFKTYDYMGSPASAGKLTEEFLSPGRTRLMVENASLDGAYAPEDQATMGEPVENQGGYMQRFLLDALLHAGPLAKELETAKLKEKDDKLGAMTLRCITVDPGSQKGRTADSGVRAYCLSSDAPMIRMGQRQYGLMVIYNKLVRFHGHVVAEDVTVQQRGKLRGKLQVTRLVLAPELKEADFPEVPANERIQLDPKTRLASNVAGGNVLRKVAPVYPLDSKMHHIAGSVILHAVIGKSGTIESLEVISAPAEDMAEAAMEAVGQWRYKPYLLDGRPTEVDTTVTVNFSFGG